MERMMIDFFQLCEGRWIYLDDKSAENLLINNGYEGVKIFSDCSYDSALIGVTSDNRAVYNYDLMIEWLMVEDNFTQDEAVEWIDYNTIRALPYAGDDGPIIMYSLYN